ncbi:MAG: aminotransferase class V-fold PLP-dependent enzyme [Roseobacter sp.]
MDVIVPPKAPFAYLNMAGASPVSDAVLRETAKYLKIEQSQGAYNTELDHHAALDELVYQNIGALLNCNAVDVAIFDNATRAWIEVVSRVPLDDAQIIMTTEYEYAGNLQFLKDLAARRGLELVVIPTNDTSDLDLNWLKDNICDEVGLVSVVHVPSCCGIVNPVAEIGAILKGHRAVFCVDACQAVGQVPIDIVQIGCDALTGAGRKFLCGPRGTGFSYVSRQLRGHLIPGFVDLHLSDFQKDGSVQKDTKTARFMECAERNCGAILGLSTAIEETIRGYDRRSDGIEWIRENVPLLPDVIPIDPGQHRSGIFSFRHRTISAGDIVTKLREQGIAAWLIKGSHTPLFMLPAGHIEAVRLSSNKISLADAKQVVEKLAKILV